MTRCSQGRTPYRAGKKRAYTEDVTQVGEKLRKIISCRGKSAGGGKMLAEERSSSTAGGKRKTIKVKEGKYSIYTG